MHPPTTRFAIILALAALAVAWCVPTGAGARTVSIGAYVPGADNDLALIDRFNSQVGRDATFVLTYKDWSQAFYREQFEGIWNHGAVPMVTWEPQTASEGRVSLKRIGNGGYDRYLKKAAHSAADFDKPLLIRFGQEMNGDWFPWGGRPKAFKAAWRHVVKVFRRAGADKVQWVWTPYVNSRGGSLPFDAYFPGGKWVDWAGLDGVNWGGPRFPWRTFSQIFADSYRQLRRLTPKPMMLGEVGSGEVGGSKSQWMARMLQQEIPRMSNVRAISFWSNDDSRGDMRVDSSSAVLQTIRDGLADPLYASSRATLIETPELFGR